ncbi:uncharacterized protein LOC118761562 [Octopus sinensis]|nr:uncharacterized protein LOC118761562 [Octopus sinensis]
MSKSQQPMMDMEGVHCSDGWGKPAFIETHQQVFVPREESMYPGYRELNSADQFSEMSTLSSHNDSGHGWSVGSAGHYEELPDLCRYQSDLTWIRRNRLPHTLNRSKGDNNGYPFQPDADMDSSYNQIPLTIIGTTSNIAKHPSTVARTNDFTSSSKVPLSAVPKVKTLPRVPPVPPVTTLNN